VASTKWTPTGRWSDSRPLLLRDDDGVSTRLDKNRIAALGNAVVPQVVELIGRAILEADANCK
jgi:site-specific DNA-cytosine methylase